MKVGQNTQLATKGTTGPKTMPPALKKILNELTINEAIAAGHVTALGDDDGNFVFEHADENIDKKYAIVNGYAVGVSKNLAEALEDSDDIIGDLRFIAGVSTIEGDGFGKEFFTLGLPAGIRLGASVKKLSLEPVA
jgi:hypothetical protein